MKLLKAKKLKIGAHWVGIRYTDDIEECGNQTTHENLIRINAKLPDDQKVATLIHEILGSANTTFHDKQHELLDATSEVFTQVLLDNDLLK